MLLAPEHVVGAEGDEEQSRAPARRCGIADGDTVDPERALRLQLAAGHVVERGRVDHAVVPAGRDRGCEGVRGAEVELGAIRGVDGVSATIPDKVAPELSRLADEQDVHGSTAGVSSTTPA